MCFCLSILSHRTFFKLCFCATSTHQIAAKQHACPRQELQQAAKNARKQEKCVHTAAVSNLNSILKSAPLLMTRAATTFNELVQRGELQAALLGIILASLWRSLDNPLC